MASQLPLFPLDVVLFPGATMPLHIFEQRYLDLVDDVMAQDKRFGMIYHDPDQHGPFQCDAGQVGCVAVIREHQGLTRGRSMILVEGVERFIIEEYVDSPTRYYESMVESYGDWAVEFLDPEERRLQTVELFRTVLQQAGSEAEGLSEESPRLDSTQDVTFLLAGLIRVTPEWQQGFLELRREPERLDRLDLLLRLALADEER